MLNGWDKIYQAIDQMLEWLLKQLRNMNESINEQWGLGMADRTVYTSAVQSGDQLGYSSLSI